MKFLTWQVVIMTTRSKPKSNNSLYTPNERQRRMADLYEDGLSQKAIAAMFGCDVLAVRKALRALGVPRCRNGDRRAISQQERRQMAALYESGLSLREVTTKVGRNPETVRQAVLQFGTMRRPKGGQKTFDHRQIADLYESGLLLKEVAAKIGCCVDTVKKALYECGVEIKQVKSYLQQDRQRIVDLYVSGLTRKEVAAEFGCCINTVNKVLVERGIVVLKKRFSKRVRQQMAALYENGLSVSEIAEKFHCTAGRVGQLLRHLGVKTIRESGKQNKPKCSQ